MAHEFAVWAPDRTTVGLVLDDRIETMTAGADGWWSVTVPDAGPGTDYAFALDGGDPLPDPRSRWQPHGVHAPSRVVEVEPSPADAAWTGRSLPGSVIYEMHVGTFTEGGTFASAEERLDHLVELGVDLVEVLPVNAFDGTRGWGYDGVLWYAVTENYGGPVAFRRFVDACHARGLGVVLDVVYNHLGPSGAYLDRFGPYFLGENVWGPSLNLDGPGSDTVRRYILDNVTMWLRDYGVDALRLDAVHALRDARATHLLEEMAQHVATLSAHLRRPLTLIAESDLNDPRLITPREAGGYGLDAQWCDDIHHALHSALTGETQGYYADFGAFSVLADVLHHPFHHAGHLVELPRAHPRPARRHAHDPRPPVPRLPPGPRPDRQPRRGRPAVGHRVAGPPRLRGRAGALLAVHPDAVHGRGVGRVDAVGVLRRLRGPRAAGRRARGASRGVRRARLGRLRRARPDGALDVRGLAARLVRRSTANPTPGCSGCTAS